MVSMLLAAARSRLLYLAALLGGLVLYYSATNPFFGTLANFKGLGATAASLGIVAVGVTLALAAGVIDFSVAGNMALSGVLVAWLDLHVSSPVGIAASLAAATSVGIVNGIVVTRFGINPFIATLAMAGSLRGLAFIVTGSSAGIVINAGPLASLGQNEIAGMPNTLITLAVVAIVGGGLLRLTSFGRSMLAVGGNPEAARLAGISVARVRASGYLISAFAAGLGGVVLAGRQGAGLPQTAKGQELVIFSAVILGGTSLWGGRASVIGSILGIFLINVLYNAFALTHVSPYWQIIIQGALLIVAVWMAQQQDERRDLVWLFRKWTDWIDIARGGSHTQGT